MKAGREQFLGVRAGEWGLVLSLLVLLALNTMVLQLASVVATTGFISQVGTSQVPLLWIVDMAITLLTAGVYALVVDRTARVQLVTWLLAGFAFFYLALQMLFVFGAPDWLTYPLLYILSDQQYVVFPLAFWSLANDVYSMSESKRLFPVIAAGAALGSIAGNGLAAGSAALLTRQGQSAAQLLVLGAVVFLIGVVFVQFSFRKRQVRARQARESGADVGETLRVGFDVIKNVPLFRYLASAMLLVGLSLTIVEYHFLFTIDQEFAGDPLRFQTFYGVYQAALIVVTWLFQWLVTSRLLNKVEPRNTFVALPLMLIATIGGALAVPGIIGGAGARFVARLLQRGWDEPARKSVQGLVPDERRGRVSAFLDSYFYAVATIVGCLVLGALFLASSAGWLQERVVGVIYLVVAAVTAVGAVWLALRLRAAYERSLLDWRLARSRRRSVLDGIDFD
jgi:AAA family ATP:ADP antiporter